LYKRALAVIVPSLCYEMFPLVILESFGQHTPVIVRNLGALPEAVYESGGGMVYESDSQLLAAIERFAINTHDREEAGRRGYEIVQKRYTVGHHLENYFSLIKQIAAQKGIKITLDVDSLQENYSRQATE
jgi:glycosyltransferase involved in cell wall biosynthesis